MKRKPKRRTSNGGTSKSRRLKPLNSFRAMERLIASTEELAHVQGMSLLEMLVAANALTAAALRQAIAATDPALLPAPWKRGIPAASGQPPATH